MFCGVWTKTQGCQKLRHSWQSHSKLSVSYKSYESYKSHVVFLVSRIFVLQSLQRTSGSLTIVNFTWCFKICQANYQLLCHYGFLDAHCHINFGENLSVANCFCNIVRWGESKRVPKPLHKTVEGSRDSTVQTSTILKNSRVLFLFFLSLGFWCQKSGTYWYQVLTPSPSCYKVFSDCLSRKTVTESGPTQLNQQQSHKSMRHTFNDRLLHLVTRIPWIPRLHWGFTFSSP